MGIAYISCLLRHIALFFLLNWIHHNIYELGHLRDSAWKLLCHLNVEYNILYVSNWKAVLLFRSAYPDKALLNAYIAILIGNFYIFYCSYVKMFHLLSVFFFFLVISFTVLTRSIFAEIHAGTGCPLLSCACWC